MSERWQTPPEIFDPLFDEFMFDLDAFADEQTRRVPVFCVDALAPGPWPGTTVWANPPYGLKLEPCVRRCAEEAALGKTVVALIPFRCRAAWWHEAVISRASEVRCVRKRIRFIRLDGTRGAFTGSCDSCVVVWRPGARAETLLKGWN
jgi:hypothetical protein